MARASRILVVEDDATLRGAIAEVMADEGHAVEVAVDGVDALDHIDRWDPDVLILDVMMPRMDAYEFRERQLATRGGRRASIVVVSAATDLPAAATRLRANAWLAKPFTLASLVGAVDQCLNEMRTPPASSSGTVDGASGAPA